MTVLSFSNDVDNLVDHVFARILLDYGVDDLAMVDGASEDFVTGGFGDEEGFAGEGSFVKAGGAGSDDAVGGRGGAMRDTDYIADFDEVG